MSTWKLKVELDTDVTECQCCGKRNLKRTIHISGKEIGDLHLGVICASEWFLLNLTGNPFYAAAKLERHINDLSKSELEEIIEQIKEDSESW